MVQNIPRGTLLQTQSLPQINLGQTTNSLYQTDSVNFEKSNIHKDGYANYLMKLLTVSHPKLDFNIPKLEEDLNELYKLYQAIRNTDNSSKNLRIGHTLSDYLVSDAAPSTSGQAWSGQSVVQLGSGSQSWGNTNGPGRLGVGQTIVQESAQGLSTKATGHGGMVQANLGDAVVRASKLTYVGSGPVGVGVGTQVGARVRANAADATVNWSRGDGSVDIDGQKLDGLTGQEYVAQAMLGATARSRLEADVGTKGFKLGMNTTAFAGANIGANAGANVLGVGQTYQGQEWNGLGFKFDPSISFSDGKLKVGMGLGAALGVGGYEGATYTLDIAKIAKELEAIAKDPAGIWSLIKATADSYGGVDDLKQVHEALIKEFQHDADLAQQMGDVELAAQMRAEVDYLQKHDGDFQTQKDLTTAKGAVGIIQTPTRLRQLEAVNRLVYKRAGDAARWLANKSGVSDSRIGVKAGELKQAVDKKITAFNDARKAKLAKVSESISDAVKESKIGKAAARVSKSASETMDAIKSSDAVTSLVTKATELSDAVSQFAEPFSKGVQSALIALKGADGAWAASLRAALGVSEESTIEVPVVGEAVVAAATIVGAVVSGVAAEMDDKQKINASNSRITYDDGMIKALEASRPKLEQYLTQCVTDLKTSPQNPALISLQSKLQASLAELSKAVANLQADKDQQSKAVEKVKTAMATDWFFGAGTSINHAHQDLHAAYQAASSNMASSNVAKKVLGGAEYVGATVATAADSAGRILKNIFVPCS